MSDMATRPKLETIGFGGGCHWCTEAIFQALIGVESVKQGFIRSVPPASSYSEAVEIEFDPLRIDLASLVEIHVRTHAATSNHSLRSKYRSAVYTNDADQFASVARILEQLESAFGGQLVTKTLENRGFRPSDKRFHNYYLTNPERPFCRRYIDPKLDILRAKFQKHLAFSQSAANT